MRPTHDLLDGTAHRRRVVAQDLQLVGELRERDDRPRDGIPGRIRARRPQQTEEELQFLLGELRRILTGKRRVADDRQHVLGRVRAFLRDQLRAVLEQ